MSSAPILTALILTTTLAAQSCGSTTSSTTTMASMSAAPRQDQAKDIVGTAVAAGSFKTLATALQHAGLVEALQGKGPFTVFAPTDAAFARLPEGTLASLLKPENKDRLVGILTYHVVPGRMLAKDVVARQSLGSLGGKTLSVEVGDDGVRIAGAKVVKTDVLASNGVIHVLDAVLLPPEMPSIVGLAQKAGKFGTLLAAAKAAGLAEVLDQKGPFTIFAPTDAAFAKLPEGTVASLLKPENKARLQAILKYHVVSGRVSARDAVVAGEAKTLNGQSLSISIASGRLQVQDAAVIGSDLDANNGVVHVIDGVLLPR